MPAEWWFYHVERTSLEAAVGPLLEKCLERSWRVLVVGEGETLTRLDAQLWTWREESFIPHGLAGPSAARQPVLLNSTPEPLNGAKVALLLDGMDAGDAPFERCMVVFHGQDETARAKARKQYQAATAAGAITRYFQQAESGGWTERQPGKPRGA